MIKLATPRHRLKFYLAAFFLCCFPANSVSSPVTKQEVNGKQSTTKQKLYRTLSKTHLRGRIVLIRVKNKFQPKIHLTWQPYKYSDVAKDAYIIVKSVSEVVPNFYSVSLKAIEPESFRWTKRVFWRNIITRQDLELMKEKRKSVSDNPQPLLD